jgi:hypothetical protein
VDPWSRGIKIESIVVKLESKESSAIGKSSKDSMEGFSQGGTLKPGGSARSNWERCMFARSKWGSHFGLQAELDMVSTISFVQANLQHSTAASRVLSRTVSVKGIDKALIQEAWYHEDHIRGLNIPGYTLFSTSGTDRPQACILTRNETAWMLL